MLSSKLNLSPINFLAQPKTIKRQTTSFCGLQPLTKDTITFSAKPAEDDQKVEKRKLATKYNFKNPEKFTANEKKLIKLGILPDNLEVMSDGKRLTLQEIDELYPALSRLITNTLQSEIHIRDRKFIARLNGINPSEIAGWTIEDYTKLGERLSEIKPLKDYSSLENSRQLQKNVCNMPRKDFESAIAKDDFVNQILNFKYDPEFNDIEKSTITYCMPSAAENEQRKLKRQASQQLRVHQKEQAAARMLERHKIWQQRTGLENPGRLEENKWQLGLPQNIPDSYVEIEKNRRKLLIDAAVLGLKGFDPCLSVDKDPQLENYKRLEETVNNTKFDIAYKLAHRLIGEVAAKEFLADMKKFPDCYVIPCHLNHSLLEAEWLGFKTEGIDFASIYFDFIVKQGKVRDLKDDCDSYNLNPDKQITPEDFALTLQSLAS